MNEVQFFDLYEVREGEEFGPGPVLGYFREEPVAREFAKGKGWWGGEGYVKKVDALKVNGLFYVLARNEPVDVDLEKAKYDAYLRAKTIASLTSEQIRVLGIKP